MPNRNTYSIEINVFVDGQNSPLVPWSQKMEGPSSVPPSMNTKLLTTQKRQKEIKKEITKEEASL